MSWSVFINGVNLTSAVMLQESPPAIDWLLGARSTCGLYVKKDAYRPVVGHGVAVFYEGTQIYGGSIHEYTEQNPIAISLKAHQVKVVSWEQRLDKRRLGPVVYGYNPFTANAATDTLSCPHHEFRVTYPVRVVSTGTLPAPLTAGTTYYVTNPGAGTLQLSTIAGGAAIDIGNAGTGTHELKWMAGGIVRHILFTLVVEDIFPYSGEVDPGGVLDIASYDSVIVSDIFDGLAALSQYIWWVDPAKQLHFKSRLGNSAPFNIDDTTGEVLASNGIGMAVRRTREQLANRVYVRFPAEAAAHALLSFTGDGATRRFWNAFVQKAVTLLSVNAIPKTFGVFGVDTGMEWYYTAGDHWLIQDPGQPVLTSADTLSIIYIGVGTDLAMAEDPAAQAAQAAIEGGTGVYERLVDTSDSGSPDGAQRIAEAELALYKLVPTEVSYSTRTPGLAIGQIQTIRPASLGIDDTYLIQSIRAVCDPDGVLRYDVAAISTTRLKTFLDTFKAFNGAVSSGGSAVSGGSGGGGAGGAGVTVRSIALVDGPGVTTISEPFTSGLLIIKVAQSVVGGRRIAWSADFAAGTPVDLRLNATEETVFSFVALSGAWTLFTAPIKPSFEL